MPSNPSASVSSSTTSDTTEAQPSSIGSLISLYTTPIHSTGSPPILAPPWHGARRGRCQQSAPAWPLMAVGSHGDESTGGGFPESTLRQDPTGSAGVGSG